MCEERATRYETSRTTLTLAAEQKHLVCEAVQRLRREPAGDRADGRVPVPPPPGDRDGDGARAEREGLASLSGWGRPLSRDVGRNEE